MRCKAKISNQCWTVREPGNSFCQGELIKRIEDHSALTISDKVLGRACIFRGNQSEATRGGLQPLRLAAGETAVWDGRFEITANKAMEVRSASGLRQRLTPMERDVLGALPASARDTVPVVVEDGDARLADAAPLALDRLLAACGAVEVEPA